MLDEIKAKMRYYSDYFRIEYYSERVQKFLSVKNLALIIIPIGTVIVAYELYVYLPHWIQALQEWIKTLEFWKF